MTALWNTQLKGITSSSAYPSGRMKDCKVNERNEIIIGNTAYIPRYSAPDERKKDNKSISFFESGKVKSIALEEQMEVDTPIGKIDAELITFYESGNIDSIFPTNGQIGFGWSEEEEEKLLKEIKFKLPIGEFDIKIIGVRFYESKKVKSIILWPKQNADIQTPLGEYSVRIGIRLYENGCLESFEPAKAVELDTPIGKIMAFDQNALGMDADINSVVFTQEGTLAGLMTNSDIVAYDTETGSRNMIYQQLRLDKMSGQLTKLPVKISFRESQVTIDNGQEPITFVIEKSRFLFLYDGSYREKKCSPGSDCSGCGASCM